MRNLFAWVPRVLGHPLNTLLGLGLFVFLVVLPICGVTIGTGAMLVGGNLTNTLGYLGASIAAGASVVNLAEHREHRRNTTELLVALHIKHDEAQARQIAQNVTQATPPDRS